MKKLGLAWACASFLASGSCPYLIRDRCFIFDIKRLKGTHDIAAKRAAWKARRP